MTWVIDRDGNRILELDDRQSIVCHMSASLQNPEVKKDALLIAAAPELLEACRTFAEWLRREDEGFVKVGNERNTPEGEAAWDEWWWENIRLCGLAQDQVRAAIAKATGEQP